MMNKLKVQFSRLLSMDRKLLPAWKACVEKFDRCQDPLDSLGITYTRLIDRVYLNQAQQVDLGLFLDQLQELIRDNEAKNNYLKFDRALYPTQEDLVHAYEESVLRDYEDLDEWLNEFLVDYYFPQSKEGAF